MNLHALSYLLPIVNTYFQYFATKSSRLAAETSVQ